MSASRAVILGSFLLGVAAVAAGQDSTRALMQCHENLLAVKYAVLQCDHLATDNAEDLAFCRNQQQQVQKWVDEAAAKAAACDAGLIHAAVLYDRLRTLATAGDLTAQRCFITGHFGTSDTSSEFEESRLRKDQVKDFPALARKFIDAAFQRGDWRVVRWLSRTRFYMVDGMLAAAYPFGDRHPETSYRMEYLLMLGNQADGRGDDPRRIVGLWKKTVDCQSSRWLTRKPGQRHMHEKHFKESGDTGSEMCGPEGA